MCSAMWTDEYDAHVFQALASQYESNMRSLSRVGSLSRTASSNSLLNGSLYSSDSNASSTQSLRSLRVEAARDERRAACFRRPAAFSPPPGIQMEARGQSKIRKPDPSWMKSPGIGFGSKFYYRP